MNIEVSIVGPPRPLKRARFARAGKFVRAYDPDAALKKEFALQVAPFLATPCAGPLKVQLDFFFKRPASHCDTKGNLKASAPRSHTQRPDADNLAKFVLDALNGIAWTDDAQVVELRAKKHWSTFNLTRLNISPSKHETDNKLD